MSFMLDTGPIPNDTTRTMTPKLVQPDELPTDDELETVHMQLEQLFAVLWVVIEEGVGE